MEENECKQNADTLHIEFYVRYDNDRELTSREFVLCGLVTVQLKTAKTSNIRIFYIRTTKTFESDNFIYRIEVTSDQLNFGERKLIVDFESSNPCWQILYQREVSYGFNSFDIKINMKIDTSSRTNPAFSILYDDNDLTDFELRGQDGTVPVHKAVLASISPVMKTMLNGEWKETSTGVVEIPNTTKETLQQLKDYMYLKKLPESGLENLAALASCYMIADFEELWTTKLLLTLTSDNAQELLDFAAKHTLKKLRLAIMQAAKWGAVDLKALIKEFDSEQAGIVLVLPVSESVFKGKAPSLTNISPETYKKNRSIHTITVQ